MVEKFTPCFYGRRKGRPLRKHKAYLMANSLSQYLLLDSSSLDYTKEIWLEIGFGKGEHLAQLAEQNPHIQFLGCEVFENGIASLVEYIEDRKLKNIFIYKEDVRLILQKLPSACINKAFMMFPDPWPKKPHQKRRLANSALLTALIRILKPSGEFRFASDNEEYIQEVFKLIQEEESFIDFTLSSAKPFDWPLTVYNQKAIQKGRASWYLKTFKK
jgi:tRNA (guanine-N7-)-methyltransferase